MSLLREAERCVANQRAHAGLNALIAPLQRSEEWLSRVRQADIRRENKSPKSRLDGRLVTIKDNICTRDFPTTCGSGILDKYSSPFNATVVEQLEKGGAIIAGKTNLDEFGMGSHSVHSRFGPVKNQHPRHGRDVSAGGSSGGSAVAVATDQCYAALGTDTGGSVRLPAAYTGTVGFKPSYGLISRWGVVAYANSLDTVGILGKDTSSVRAVFDNKPSKRLMKKIADVVNRHDPRDPTNLSPSSRSRILSSLDSPQFASRLASRPLKIGFPKEYNVSELTPAVRRAWMLALSHLRKQGHTIHPVSVPATKSALSAYYVIAPAEASSNLAKYDGVRYGTRAEGPDGEGRTDGYLYGKTRGQGFGDEVKRRVLLGTFSLSADAIDNYFLQAQRIRRLVVHDFNAVFNLSHPLADTSIQNGPESENAQREVQRADVDVLVCPTAPSAPPFLDSLLGGSASSPLDAYVNDIFTVPASLAGLPAISVPISLPDPQSQDPEMIGIQVIGQYGDDELVLKVGGLLEGQKLS
ncbi:hypothetical protein ASPZODRAFT_2110317 [Penicilliopsis zonata CBS 506.65]|uniref:Glutamyl-tRNA(Gln) amidotransferase subunit A, mitochondrial n=1 Tax=Penicilliopsis zonata CBS 506.65 TaxID=1073090 RepID=A0A1L9SE69_9EURO|nr:hypothetical protein ASPZODRAFT_2110317 [Penicilliopsis zonata CBS 506.65]OJJ45525.1 hypothetical protein ASPZODRAFT_2110317 [Penicilliopsis zonata CBS 506.65]